MDTDLRLAAYGREPDNSQPPYEDATPPSDGLPYPFSSDLVGGYTNAWYTTTDRDPFDNVEVGGVVDIEYGGPRWRLIANKFGQDIPGLEIPKDDCSPVPYTSSNIRYPVGEFITTTINLLDWADGDSPLASSKGWVNAKDNIQNYTKDPDSGDPEAFVNTGPNGVSINGAPLTDDFDLVIYIKGDRKATALYTAKLELTYMGEAPPPPVEIDAALLDVELPVPATASIGDTIQVGVVIENKGTTDIAAGTVALVGLDKTNGWVQVTSVYTPRFYNLTAGESRTVPIDVLIPAGNEAGDYDMRFWSKVYVTGDSVPDNDATMDKDVLAVTE